MSKLNIKVEKLNCLQHSEEWLMLRNQYIGASEIGALINIDKYTTVKDLLFDKCGFTKRKVSKPMAIGSLFEKDILEKFNYYEYDEDTTYNNYITNRKVREAIRVYDSYLLTINDVPFLVSPDGYIVDDNNKKIPIETKFIDTFSIKGNNIEMSIGKYAWQSVFQQLVFNVDYGYIFTLVSNRGFVLDKIMLSKYVPLLENVLEKAREFYQNRVAIINSNMSINEVAVQFYPEVGINKFSNIKDELLPEKQPLVKLNTFKKTYQPIIGDAEDVEYARKLMNMAETLNEIKNYKQVCKQYFQLKYGKIGNVIISDIYKIKIYPKFTISIASQSDVADSNIDYELDELPD